MLWFLFAVVRDVQRNNNHPHTITIDVAAVSIRCRARRTAEPCRSSRSSPLVAPVSIRCRARRTAELGPYACRGGPCVVSIRCRARRTAEPPVDVAGRAALVSIRCRARRTGNRWIEAAHGMPSGFYSLSCETYSGTSHMMFLAQSTVSIRCRARRTAEPYPPRQAADQRERCPIAHPAAPSSNMCTLKRPGTAVCAGRRLAQPTGVQPHVATQARFVGFRSHLLVIRLPSSLPHTGAGRAPCWGELLSCSL